MALLSKWGESLNREHPLQEYPRPQMQRSSYTNLNGMWEYQITGIEEKPVGTWKPICVPFPVGSVLSGVPTSLTEKEALHYRRTFTYPKTTNRVFLNFEAVDQVCAVFLNGVQVGTHKGGYEPFSLEVTGVIQERNELQVWVSDFTQQSIYAYGKQSPEPSGIFYTPFSGIWGTVWLEETGKSRISDIKITPLFDSSSVYIQLEGDFTQAVVGIYRNKEELVKTITSDKTLLYEFNNFRPWTTEDPFLYRIIVETDDDRIESYFGMRKFSQGIDTKGQNRFCLNDRPLFLSGLLDQGYISDGLVTFPHDEAIIEELEAVKAMGFNLLRKHVKVESRRFYYHCDRMGILVMQDMVNGGKPITSWWQNFTAMLGVSKDDHQYQAFGREDPESRKMYRFELDGMINQLYNATCICAWVPFNEGWGQFDAKKITEHILKIDNTRLIDSTSGWYDQQSGNFASRHVYFWHYKCRKSSLKRITLLSEFGGYAYMVKGHTFTEKSFGYKKYGTRKALREAIVRLYNEDIYSQIASGLSGCIYTQLSDVETEINGLFTYDRRTLKVDPKTMARINSKLRRRIAR